MSATDELRRLLDERGVEWKDASPIPSTKPWKTSFTSFTGEEVAIGAYEEPKWLMGTMVFHTPEQAIEATLGRGERTCRNKAKNSRIFWCSECDCAVEDWTDVGGTLMSVSYCPVCGAKVVKK